jgi:hypothetical protein
MSSDRTLSDGTYCCGTLCDVMSSMSTMVGVIRAVTGRSNCGRQGRSSWGGGDVITVGTAGNSDRKSRVGGNWALGRYCFTLSPRRPYEEYKRMVLEHTHGLFIT